MTVPHGDLEALLRRELTAAVDSVEPAADALERIRARTARRAPQPWLLSVLSDAVSRAQHWVWRGHWVWPDSLPRPRAVAWPGAKWAKHARRTTLTTWGTGANWLRPVAVLAGVAFIAIVTLAVPPLRQAIGHVTSNVLTGGQTSGGGGTNGNGTQGGGGGTLGNGARNTSGANPIGSGNTASPGSKVAQPCQPAAPSATPTGSSEKIAVAVSSALPATPTTACASPTATATASLPVTSPSLTSPSSTATATPTTTPTSTTTPTTTQTPTATASPTPTDTGTGSPTPTDTGTTSTTVG